MPNESVISKIKEFCDLLSIEDLEIVEKSIASIKNNKGIGMRRAAERARIEADAEAYSITTMAEAEASANAQIAASLTPELIDYTRAQAWNGEMPAVMGEATPILDMTDFLDTEE